jgi:high-affinity iron transporter
MIAGLTLVENLEFIGLVTVFDFIPKLPKPQFARFPLPRFRITQWQRLLIIALSTCLWVITATHQVFATPQADMQRLDGYLQEAIVKVQQQDMRGAATAFGHYKDTWFEIEDGVKSVSRQAYKDIETGMGEVKFALSSPSPDPAEVLKALQQLQTLDQKFMTGGFSAETAQTPGNPTHKVTIASLLSHLEVADTALKHQNISLATTQIQQFKTDWLEVEGLVAAKSHPAYVSIEDNMGNAYSFLKANPPQVASAQTAITALLTTLQPFATTTIQYTLFDAAVILLREGLEALLVLIALLAFLNKSGNANKGNWIWMGAGIGVLVSVATAIVINLVFNQVAMGANRELMEGITGLVAAVMLFYVSYWLHSKSSLMAWQGYIRNQVNNALAQNSLWSLAILSFMAVYREGAETTLFYIGIAPSINTSDLILGLGLGTVGLIIFAVLMLGLGLKIPLKPFFLVTSVLIYYLGFKFVGAGIHSLQIAGILPATPASFFPAWEGLGLYSTWETTLPQLALVAITIAVVWYTRQKAAQEQSASL